MSSKNDMSDHAGSEAPFGSRRDLSSAPLYLFGFLYVAWLILLVWMAVSESAG
jgi:hypothetical protein